MQSDEAFHRQLYVALSTHVKPRPWSQFFSAASFEKPLLADATSKRAWANVGLYSINYGLLAGCCVVIATAVNPLAFVLALAGALAAAAYRLDVRGVAEQVDARAAYGGLAAYAALLLWLTNLATLASVGLMFGGVACLLHAMMHDAPETFSAG
jgi:hypothetical protein